LKKKRRREIGVESEESLNVRWCEEIEKFGGVFIGENGKIGYNYYKCSKKREKTFIKKTCKNH